MLYLKWLKVPTIGLKTSCLVCKFSVPKAINKSPFSSAVMNTQHSTLSLEALKFETKLYKLYKLKILQHFLLSTTCASILSQAHTPTIPNQSRVQSISQASFYSEIVKTSLGRFLMYVLCHCCNRRAMHAEPCICRIWLFLGVAKACQMNCFSTFYDVLY